MNRFIEKVTGPVIPLPTPFTSSFEVDHEALYSYVQFLVSNGISNVMTTVGTSRFNLLSESEVKKVNETVVKAADGKAITIVANPTTGGTASAVDFARHAEKIGADLFLAYYPERYYGEENTFQYFKTIHDSVGIGILIHEMPMRNGMGGGNVQYSISLLERLMELKNIVGVKEEALDAEYSNKVVAALKDKAVIIGAGGGMSRYFLRDHDLGSKAFLGGLGNFSPRLELDFFEAMMKGDREKAGRIVNEIELPYFNKVVPIGWHPALKIALNLKGLIKEFERPPMKQPGATDRELVSEALRANGWL